MVKASLLMYRRLSPLKQDFPGTINGRTLRFVKAPLPTAPTDPSQCCGRACWLLRYGSGTRAVRQVLPCRPPVIVRALPVAMLTTVLVSHPPANAFRNPFRLRGRQVVDQTRREHVGRSKFDSPRLARGS